MMRYGFSGTWRSFTTAGGGPAGGQARPRVPPPHPTAVRTIPLRNATRICRATCILSSPSLSKGVVRRCAAGEPVPERVRVVRQALLVQPRLELLGLGVGGDRALEQVPLDRQADCIGGRVALAPPASPLRSVEGGEELAADDGRALVHAAPLGGGWGRSWRFVEVGGGCFVTASTILHNLHHPPPSSM